MQSITVFNSTEHCLQHSALKRAAGFVQFPHVATESTEILRLYTTNSYRLVTYLLRRQHRATTWLQLHLCTKLLWCKACRPLAMSQAMFNRMPCLSIVSWSVRWLRRYDFTSPCKHNMLTFFKMWRCTTNRTNRIISLNKTHKWVQYANYWLLSAVPQNPAYEKHGTELSEKYSFTCVFKLISIYAVWLKSSLQVSTTDKLG